MNKCLSLAFLSGRASSRDNRSPPRSSSNGGHDRPTGNSGSGGFESKAQTYLPQLVKDLGITQVQAAAILGNLGHESAGLQPNINEKNPTVKGSKGGYGWGQWTGSRRYMDGWYIHYKRWMGRCIDGWMLCVCVYMCVYICVCLCVYS